MNRVKIIYREYYNFFQNEKDSPKIDFNTYLNIMEDAVANYKKLLLDGAKLHFIGIGKIFINIKKSNFKKQIVDQEATYKAKQENPEFRGVVFRTQDYFSKLVWEKAVDSDLFPYKFKPLRGEFCKQVFKLDPIVNPHLIRE